MRHPVQGVLAGTARAAGSAVFAAAIFSPVCAKADTILWVDKASGNIGQVDINTQSVVAGSVHPTGVEYDGYSVRFGLARYMERPGRAFTQ